MRLAKIIPAILLITVSLPAISLSGGALPGDVFAQFTLEGSTNPAQGGPTEIEGFNLKTLDGLGAVSTGYLRFEFDGDSVAKTGPGVKANIAGTHIHEGQGQHVFGPEIEVRVYGIASYFDGQGNWVEYTEGLIYRCTGDELEACPIGVFNRPEECDRDLRDSLLCPEEDFYPAGKDLSYGEAYHAYYWPEYIEVVAMSGTDVEIIASETDAPSTTLEVATTEGFIVMPAHPLANDQNGFECDAEVPYQPNTGFRLEGLDGADFDITFAFVSYEAWITEFYGIGDEWGNAPSSGHKVCINMKDRDAVGIFEYRYTDGLPRFADGDHSTSRVYFAENCLTLNFCF